MSTAFLLSVFCDYCNRAMVASVILGIDKAVFNLFGKTFGTDEIIDSPSRILFPCVEHIAPPGIGIAFFRIEITECIRKTRSEKFGHFGTFFVGESGVSAVGFIVFKVDLVMGDVHVSADYNGFMLIKRTYIFTEAIFPVHAVFKAFKVASCVGNVNVNKIKIRIFKGDDSALVVMAFNVDSVIYGKGFVLCENCGSGIAFFSALFQNW